MTDDNQNKIELSIVNNLKIENAQLRTALEFYATKKNWQPAWNSENKNYVSNIDSDQGKIAQKAMEAKTYYKLCTDCYYFGKVEN